ncbi:hypothetical protein GGR32_001882 [Mesonia hippocampi]|uniref:Riboflavin synthase subunit beta n=1 Tax=Mesonia hippocampi TaxID=1628250 RepID=A0A840ERI7_9FLAO|nr:hypothetical protein [Mesonia hippocampi]MBB4119580.1 hypothetical protein [Mesonia hippocampi]
MLKLNMFKRRDNNRYNYTPRYYKGKDLGNPYDFDSKFAKYREATNAVDFGSQWAKARKESRTRSNRNFSGRVLVIAAILIFIFLWLIDFDLSIFF